MCWGMVSFLIAYWAKDPTMHFYEWVGFEGAWAQKWAQRNIRVALLSRREAAAR
jgi:hypothetical protein